MTFMSPGLSAWSSASGVNGNFNAATAEPDYLEICMSIGLLTGMNLQGLYAGNLERQQPTHINNAEPRVSVIQSALFSMCLLGLFCLFILRPPRGRDCGFLSVLNSAKNNNNTQTLFLQEALAYIRFFSQL